MKGIQIITISISLLFLFSCTSTLPTIDTAAVNSKASMEKPYVILISLDGFRWDYVERFQPPHMLNFIKNGVQASSLIPSFPSKTFPNHYTIATGMYPENHGIIGNSFYSYKKDKLYRLGDRETVEDGSFYGGTPIWVAAEKADMVSASYFFVGTEADIQGIRPSYYYTFDNSIKNEVRVRQALDWLGLPQMNRPHLITMYFSDMDNIGHDFGPNNDEKLKSTLFALDKHLGDLFQGVAATNLPVNIIIVSDHGMAPISVANYIPIESVENDALFHTLNNGALMNIHPKEGVPLDTVYSYLKSKEDHFRVYLTRNTPGFEYTPKNKDWGAVQVLPDVGYYFISSKRLENLKKSDNEIFGVHGYDPQEKDTHGIFYAQGPAFKKGYLAKPIRNIDIYPLLCTILDIKIPEDIDGNLEEIREVLERE